MSVNAILERDDSPTEARIKASLGSTWPLFEELQSLTAACAHDWKHYGRKYGWKLKVHANDKMLFELTVADGWFLVAMAIREKERQALQADPAAASAADVAGTPAPEGYGIKIEVRDSAAFERAKSLVRFIMAQRSLG